MTTDDKPVALNVTNPAEEIRDMEARMRVFHGQITALRSDEHDGSRISGSIDMHLERIQWHQAQIDVLNYRRNNIPALIKGIQEQLHTMRKKLNTIRHRHALAKLIRLRKEMNELAGNLFDDVEDTEIPAVFHATLPSDYFDNIDEVDSDCE